MNPNPDRNRARWSKEELEKAEATAKQFLEDNASQICDTLRAKMKFLELLVHRLSLKKTTLDQRLDCFARLSEVADLLKDDADGFFELASQPVIAKTLLHSKPQK